MKKLSFYTILCCLAVSMYIQPEFMPGVQHRLSSRISSSYGDRRPIGICRISQIPEYDYFQYQFQYSWKIKSNKNWCVPTPAMSSASSLIAEVSVIMEENPDEQKRTAILTITADGIKESKTVTITKSAKGTLLVQGFDDPFLRVKVVKLPLPSLPIKRGK